MDAILLNAFQHHQAGNLSEAERLYRQVLAIDPNHVDALHLLGLIATACGHYNEAARLIGQAISIRPSEAAFHYNLGCALEKAGQLDRAASAFRQATQLKPDYAEAYNNLGNALQAQSHLGEAVEAYRGALAVRPDYLAAKKNLANVLIAQESADEAVDLLRAVAAALPNDPDVWNSLGVALGHLEQSESAIACERKALELNPRHIDARSNLAVAYRMQGRYKESAAELDRVLQLAPDDPYAHFSLGFLELLQGDFERGWKDYEYCWKITGLFERKIGWRERQFTKPRWDGSPLNEKTIVLHAEQGLGDTLQFVRFAAVVRASHPQATIICECQRHLVAILARCKGIDRLVPVGEPLPDFDFQCSLMGLPLSLGTTLDSIPRDVPYVYTDPALVALWRQKLIDLQGKRIGINWQGRGSWRHRDIPIERFQAVAEIPGVSLISLQKGERPPKQVIDLGEIDAAHGAFMDTAAIMINLDLVITSDTAVAHLAGALGVPVWVALPYVPDWRWLLKRSDSPWYPTMRLFRQKKPGDWAGVFEEIEAALRERVS
jgi:Flp pilus assembly protein TadD